jgi:hypothetical protein
MLPALQGSAIETNFEDDLQEMIAKYAVLWTASSTCLPVPFERFDEQQQKENEHEADRLIDSMAKELRRYPDNEIGQTAWRARQFMSLRQLGTRSFGYPDSHFNIIFSPEYFAATRDFARQARAFDERLEIESIGQAMRNVWVMNTLQVFLGRAPSLSPSVFAYSMLYPYTDNLLDRPGLSQKAKKTASDRLRLRLSGGALDPCNDHESAVFRLVGMIECEYPRDCYPEIYESLLAIHAGQAKSLMQQRSDSSLDESALLLISIEKGGSSVLADGWLVGGRLTQDEADRCFGFGVVLQLLDDLQDIPDDRRARHRTLFACTTSQKSLDDLTSRLWHFLHRFLDSMVWATDRGIELRDLIRRNCTMLLLRSVAESGESYTQDYANYLERFSPLSFAFLKARQHSAAKQYSRIWPALARRRNLRSIFDLMG